MDKDTLIELLAMNVEHMALSYGRDWWQCKSLVDKLKSMPRWDVLWGRRVSPCPPLLPCLPPLPITPPLACSHSLSCSLSLSLFLLSRWYESARERSKECEVNGCNGGRVACGRN